MDIKDETKDNVKARLDVAKYCKCSVLHLVKRDGKAFKPIASYFLTKEDLYRVFTWVKQLRLLDGFDSNIGRYFNVEEGKVKCNEEP